MLASTDEPLLKPGNRDKLRVILTHHVTPVKVMAQEVVRPIPPRPFMARTS